MALAAHDLAARGFLAPFFRLTHGASTLGRHESDGLIGVRPTIPAVRDDES